MGTKFFAQKFKGSENSNPIFADCSVANDVVLPSPGIFFGAGE